MHISIRLFNALEDDYIHHMEYIIESNIQFSLVFWTGFSSINVENNIPETGYKIPFN